MKTWRFVVLSDTHFFAPGNGKDGKWWYRTLHSRSEQIAAAIIDTIVPFQPEFVIHCGDFTGLCDMDNFEHGRNVMDNLGCPWYVVPGNHDTWYPGVREAISSPYDLEPQRCYYHRLVNGIHFLFLDTCHWAAQDGQVDPYLSRDPDDKGQNKDLCVHQEQLDWLKEQLNSCPDKKAILVTHVPLRFRDFYPVKRYWNGEPVAGEKLDLSIVIDPLVNIEQLHKIIDTSPNIVGVFSGHWHINDITLKDGIFSCLTSSLREWPFEFRLVEVRDGRLSISTHGLNDPDLRKNSYIEESEHDWIAGETESREFSFPA